MPLGLMPLGLMPLALRLMAEVDQHLESERKRWSEVVEALARAGTLQGRGRRNPTA